MRTIWATIETIAPQNSPLSSIQIQSTLPRTNKAEYQPQTSQCQSKRRSTASHILHDAWTNLPLDKQTITNTMSLTNMITLTKLIAISILSTTIFASVIEQSKTDFKRISNPTKILPNIATSTLKLELCTPMRPCTREAKKPDYNPGTEKLTVTRRITTKTKLTRNSFATKTENCFVKHVHLLHYPTIPIENRSCLNPKHCTNPVQPVHDFHETKQTCFRFFTSL